MWCEQLNHTLSFYPQKLEGCCSGYVAPIYVENLTNDTKIDWDEVNRKRLDLIKNLEENNVPDSCKVCPCLHEGKLPENENYKYNKIVVNHYTHCNCRCVYCARLKCFQREFTENKKSPEFYHLLPFLKEIYALDNVDKNSMILDIQGGDLGVLDEFEDIINFLLENQFWSVYFTTNNIKYQPVIEKCLAIEKGEIISSLDCGCRETYLKLKQVDKFDDYVENLKKYISVAKNKNDILISYILVKNINDNEEEVRKFFDLIKNIGIKRVRFEVDFNLLFGEKAKIPKHYKDLLDLFEELSAKNGLELLLQPNTKNILNEIAEKE